MGLPERGTPKGKLLIGKNFGEIKKLEISVVTVKIIKAVFSDKLRETA